MGQGEQAIEVFHPCRYLRAWLFGTVLMSIAISIGLHYLFASPLPYLLFLAVALSLQTFLLGVLPGRARIEFDGSAFDAFDCWGKWKGRVRAKEIGPVGLWSEKKEFLGYLKYHVCGDAFEFSFTSSSSDCGALLNRVLQGAYGSDSGSGSPSIPETNGIFKPKSQNLGWWSYFGQFIVLAPYVLRTIDRLVGMPVRLRNDVPLFDFVVTTLLIFAVFIGRGFKKHFQIEVINSRLTKYDWRGKKVLDADLSSIKPGSMSWSAGSSRSAQSFSVMIGGKKLHWHRQYSDAEKLTELIRSYARQPYLPIAVKGPPEFAKLDSVVPAVS